MFRNAEAVTLHRLPAQRRRFLVFVRAGSSGTSPVAPEHLGEARDFDLAVSYFAPPALTDPMAARADILLGGGLSKLHAAKGLLQAWPDALDYEGAMFVDDDVVLRFPPGDFFGFCQQQGFALAQPSLSADSFCNFLLLRHNPSFICRTTNFVEVMAPWMSRPFLHQVWQGFDRTISGWGLDMLWSSRLGDGVEAAVVDRFQMHHARPMSLDGAFYRYLDSIGVDCLAELRSVFDELGATQFQVMQGRLIYDMERIGRPPEGVTWAGQVSAAAERR
jgi:hypothetical protein